MRGDDKTMNSMKHNGQPSIDDEDPIKRTVLANYYTHLEKSEPGGGKIDLDRNITLGTSNGNNLPGSGGLNAVSPHSETQDDCDGSIDSFEEANSQPPSPRTGPAARVRPPRKVCPVESKLFPSGLESIGSPPVTVAGSTIEATSPLRNTITESCIAHTTLNESNILEESSHTSAGLDNLGRNSIPETQTPPSNSPKERLSRPITSPMELDAHQSPSHSPPSNMTPDTPREGDLSSNNNIKHAFSNVILNSDNPDRPMDISNSTLLPHTSSSPAPAPPHTAVSRIPIKNSEIDDIVTRQQTLQSQIHETNHKQRVRGFALIRRLLTIRAKLNNGVENQQRVTPTPSLPSLDYHIARYDAKIRREQSDTESNRSKLPSSHSDKSNCDMFHSGDRPLYRGQTEPAPETDESDLESEVGFTNDKIGAEQKKIRQREKMEEQRTALIEAKRVWLIKSINRCSKVSKTLQQLITQLGSDGASEWVKPDSEDEDACARTKPVKRKVRPKMVSISNYSNQSSNDYGVLGELDPGYHHILSDARCVPLSIRLGSVLHNYVPLEKLAKKSSKERSRVGRHSFDKEKQKRLRQKDQNIENNIVVPPSSLFATIEMPKYKDIDTPGFRSPDSDMSSGSEDSDEDISDCSFIRRHMIAEKKEKERYYQSAISQSRKRKKLREEIDPRLASPKEGSYHVETIVRTDCYKRREYPLPDPQLKARKQKEKIAKRSRQEWRSSTTEGNGLRLKLSLRKT